MSYASGTAVPIERSKAEIEKILAKYGAHEFGYVSRNNGAEYAIRFTIKFWSVQITLPMPLKSDEAFTLTPSGRYRYENEAVKHWEQGCKARWRALVLIIKAKLEAVDAGISTVEREFFVDIVMPNGGTVGEKLLPQIAESYKSSVPMLTLDQP
jgi:hypothetical protein